VNIRSIISKHFNENTFTGEEKVYKTTESIEATPHWGEWECIREFVQNALDEMTPEIKRDFEEVRKPIGGVDFEVNSRFDGVYIWDKGRGVRIIDILITGLSRKAIEMKPTRGEFGEGIKKAVATLLRLGRKVKIYTKNGYEVIPEVGIIEIEGEKTRVVQYRVRKYDTRMEPYGTVVYVNTQKFYTGTDFTTAGIAKEPEVKMERHLYLIKPECYRILPDEIKIRMRGNEAYIYDLEKIKEYCKDRGIEDAYTIAVSYDELYDLGIKFIAYRDIILRRDINSLYSYNIWDFIPTDVMGRDRQIMSDKFLFDKIGSMYTRMSYEMAPEGKVPDKIMKNLFLVAVGNVTGVFESHITFGGFMSSKEREYWKNMLKKLKLKNVVIVTSWQIDKRIASILRYNGYEIVEVTSNFSRFTDIYPLEEVLKKLIKESEKKEKIPDEKLDENARYVLEKLRWIVDNLYRHHYIHDLKDIFERFKEKAKEQRRFEPTFNYHKPKIYAFRYYSLDEIERGRITGGHCDPEKGLIGVRVERLRTDRLYEALAVLNHELAHYVTWLTDVDREVLREATELVAGVMERALVEKYNKSPRS